MSQGVDVAAGGAQQEQDSDVLVIFGITGDLAKKMTFRALYRLERRGELHCPIVGVAGDDITVDQLVDRARQAITASGEAMDDAVFQRLAGRLTYLSGNVTDAPVYEALTAALRPYHRPLFYLEVPPALFGPIVDQLGEASLLDAARVAVEKPFGHDLASARELNARLHRHLREDQILRVDHFLGKEPVIELEYLRFANVAIAQVWDRQSVSCIQITMAENFGVEDRGRFYDGVGALRDVVQNHLMQVLALVAMEPPASASGSELRDKKAEVLRAMPAANPAHCVRGQYRGYRDIDGVAADSTTETFVALELEIDNWRWSGVPIFLRAGKSLTERVTEVRLILRSTPRLSFLPTPAQVEPNQIVLRIDPNPGFRMQLIARDEDETWRTIPLQTVFGTELGEPMEPYERLFLAALGGDHRLFGREDAIEETWRILQPLLTDPPPVQEYDPGSWGPAAADDLLGDLPPWHQPWLN
ncbi:glucose-6-phosphate 1-dehydrogenase 1 [Mycolicibacterium madagascariense]|uniref:Glucose-6-phosphate 1-dehydrogenase n=1 Tax=Mycolicibacterium madagascariense TaxID=212765 RepID=A0A7I7XLD1_9MYCO|nr:glucose-6-phosphate dehydrogenase [Mycolicibacterium madagascariense]MCV7014634.1 glucose-6-phosphate dehydrogenase [Mycolicibacterium madagascariense]BBZ29883.1 glucose-6-phosphate 1-dehydrogenase 1 [Mycolicibacterium madagascariense]